jgi:hypothetical protein
MYSDRRGRGVEDIDMVEDDLQREDGRNIS